MRLTCKACLKVVLELPRNEAAVRAGRAKETPRADWPQFRDVSRSMHVRPQVTLNALEVEVVLGLLTRNAHAHLSRFSSISGTEFVGLLDDAIESILEPTENMNGWNTGTTTKTNDTSVVSGTEATSSLSVSPSGAARQSKAFVAYCSNNTELQSAFVSQSPQPLFVRPLVMAVDADGIENDQQQGQSMEHPFDPCQGRLERPPVSAQEQQVTCSDPLRGQSAMTLVPVPGQQADSDGEAVAFLATGPFVIDQEHDERVWATLDDGCNAACHSVIWAVRAEQYFDMFGFQSEYRENTRPKVFTGLGHRTSQVPLALAFTSERDDNNHLSGTIESWELLGDGPFLFPIDAQARLGLIKDMAKSRIFVENMSGFYLRMYKDAQTGLMLINMADFDLLNDQTLTPQLLRASKPMYALPATIATEIVNTLSSLTHLPGDPTLHFTHVAIGLDVVDKYPESNGLFRHYISERHNGRARDFSVGDREDRQMLIKTLRRRFPEETHRTDIVLIDCRAFRDPPDSALRNHWGVHPTALSKILNLRKFPCLLLELVERIMRFADRNPHAKILIGFICMKARHRSVACNYLMQDIHNALKCSVNTHTTAIASRGRYLCNRKTCPDCSHRSVAAIRLMESARDRLVASWNKAVADVAARSQPLIPAVTLTPMAAAPVIPAARKVMEDHREGTSSSAKQTCFSLQGNVGAGTVGRSHPRRDRQRRSCLDTCVGERGKVQ